LDILHVILVDRFIIGHGIVHDIIHNTHVEFLVDGTTSSTTHVVCFVLRKKYTLKDLHTHLNYVVLVVLPSI
jgi:hypothetical protein